MRRALLALTLPIVANAHTALAQTASNTGQSIGLAEVELLEQCPKFAERNRAFKGETIQAAGVFAPILGGLLGDLAGAGLSAIANALETASAERAFGAEGRTNFEFYKLNAQDAAIAIPRLGTDLNCLSLKVPGAHTSYANGLDDWPPTGYEDNDQLVALTGGGDLSAQQIAMLKDRLLLKDEPLLTLEAEIVKMQDAFFLRPVYIHYATRLDGAPTTKAMPSELHVKLATPAAVSNGTASDTVFAIARVLLPKLKPGDFWWAEQIATQSTLLTFRASEGSTAALKLVLARASARMKAVEDGKDAAVQLAHAIGVRYDGNAMTGCVAITCPTYLPIDELKGYSVAQLVAWARKPATKLPADRLTALHTAEQAYATSILTFDQNSARLASLPGPENPAPTAGSTTIEARIIMTRSANKFGQAVASALKKQEAPLSTAVSGIVTKDQPLWTQAKSDLALAKLTVTHKEQALVRAKAGSDAEAIETAELALLQAKLDVNLRASALDQPVSYPELAP